MKDVQLTCASSLSRWFDPKWQSEVDDNTSMENFTQHFHTTITIIHNKHLTKEQTMPSRGQRLTLAIQPVRWWITDAFWGNLLVHLHKPSHVTFCPHPIHKPRGKMENWIGGNIGVQRSKPAQWGMSIPALFWATIIYQPVLYCTLNQDEPPFKSVCIIACWVWVNADTS
jgi:hypothetical protein